jgi:hypothetical protein
MTMDIPAKAGEYPLPDPAPDVVLGGLVAPPKIKLPDASGVDT